MDKRWSLLKQFTQEEASDQEGAEMLLQLIFAYAFSYTF